MAYSFEIHFGPEGDVIVNNIKGIPENSYECLALTEPYERSLGVPIERTMRENKPVEWVEINIQAGENA